MKSNHVHDIFSPPDMFTDRRYVWRGDPSVNFPEKIAVKEIDVDRALDRARKLKVLYAYDSN